MTFFLRASDQACNQLNSFMQGQEKVLPFVSSHLYYNAFAFLAKAEPRAMVFREPSVMPSLFRSDSDPFISPIISVFSKDNRSTSPLKRVSKCDGGITGM